MKASLPALLLLALLTAACGPSPAEAAAAMEQAYAEELIEASYDVRDELLNAQHLHLRFYERDPEVSADDVTLHVNGAPVEIERDIERILALPVPPTGEYLRARDVFVHGAREAQTSLRHLDTCWETFEATACDLSAERWDEADMTLRMLIDGIETGGYGDGL